MEARFQPETYTLEVPMDHSLVMNVSQPLGNTFQLDGSEFSAKKGCRDFRRSTYEPDPVSFGCAFVKSLVFPFTIQSNIIAKKPSNIITPWQDVWVLEGLPHNNLIAEFLRKGLSVRWYHNVSPSTHQRTHFCMVHWPSGHTTQESA